MLRHNARVGQSVVQFLAAAVAACASLTAVVLGIDQLSSGRRLRSLESMLRAVAATPDGKERDEVVASMHRTALARLIAREAVPSRAFIGSSVLIVYGLAVTLRVVVGDGSPWWFVSVMLASSALLMGIAFTLLMSLTRERARIRRWYEQGLTPLRAYADWRAELAAASQVVVLAAFGEGLFASTFSYCLIRAIVVRADTATVTLWSAAAAASVVVMAFLMIPLGTAWETDLMREPSVSEQGFEPSWVHPSPMAPPIRRRTTRGLTRHGQTGRQRRVRHPR